MGSAAYLFCDSASISALARLMYQRQDQDGTMLLAAPRANVARALAMSGLDEMIPTYPTVPDALAALPDP